MSETSTGDPGKSMKQPNNDLSEVMGQLSLTSNETSPSLSDMPVDVVGLIIERSKYKEQLLLRKVSKSLRALVDKLKPACKSIKIECHKRSISITFNHHYVVYSDDEDYYESPGNVAITDDFKKVAFDDLASILENPKLQLDKFMIVDCLDEEEREKYCNEMQCVLGSLNHQVSVTEIDLCVLSSSWLPSILPYLKPGVLKSISLILFSGADWRAGMDKVALLEQWKQAEELKTCYPFDIFPMEYATHFKRFIIDETVIDDGMLVRIRHFLSKLDNFEYCRIRHVCLKNDIKDTQRMIGTPVPPNMSHYSIPDSDYCLEFSIDLFDITIVKKICHLH